ncbi:MAG TPA: hypothetical protein VLC92_13550 [Rhodocyclaceae bacterium]|nr:hypothetical protein [Rhodocyclaceae bacterium]
MTSIEATSPPQTFKLHRLTDELVYVFQRLQDSSGTRRFAREDRLALIIECGESLGWLIRNPENGEITGEPWDDASRHHHAEHPAEGEWISKKGLKSYVYASHHARPA